MFTKLVRQYSVTSFVIITFLFSWTLWTLMILSNKGVLPFHFPTNFTGSFGPTIGAIVVTWIIQGKKGVKALLKKLFQWRTPVVTYIFAIFLMIIIYGGSVLLTYIIKPNSIEFGELSEGLGLVIYFFIVLIFGGPLGEEIGWRGFLQPQLQRQSNPFVTSLIISVIWFVWHLPLFWLEGAAQEGGSIFLFGLTVLTMSFLFTWLYNKSKGSLLLAVLFHTIINYISAILIPGLLPSLENNNIFDYITILFLILITTIFVVSSLKLFTSKVNIDAGEA